MKSFDYAKNPGSPTLTPAAFALVQKAVNSPWQPVRSGARSHNYGSMPVLPASPTLTPELPVSTPGDRYEREARNLAISDWRSAISAGNSAEGVRIHTGPEAQASAEAVNARAYTVGRDLVFGAGEYAPQTAAGRTLLRHELAHAAQQGASGTLSLQRDEKDPAKKEEDKDNAGKAITEGLSTVADQAVDNNPKVKEKLIEPVKNEAKKKWEGLKTGEKGAVIGFGVATVGTALPPLLGTKEGRKLLEGVNLAAPLTLIPYMPLTGFKYTLPTEGAEPALWKFDTSFSGDEYLKLFTEKKGLPSMSLGVNMQWGFNPATDKVSILGAQATFSPLKGVSLSGGTYGSPLAAPQVFPTAEGGIVESKKSFPGPAGGPTQPDVRIMLNIDLLKLDKSKLPKSIGAILSAF